MHSSEDPPEPNVTPEDLDGPMGTKNERAVLSGGHGTERELADTREALERRTQELSRQHDWFRVTLASIGDAVLTTDTGGLVTFLNPVAEKLTGWSGAEAQGKPVTEVLRLFNEITGAETVNPVERVLAENIIVGLANHTVLRTREGRDIPIEDSAAPIVGEDGTMHGVVFVFHDITEKHARQRELRESEARARAIVDTALDAVVIMNADGKIAGWNPAAERIFGWRQEEVFGTDLGERIIPERLREAHHRGLAHLAATGHGPVIGQRLELPAMRRDGSEFPVELSVNPLPGTGKAIYVGFIRDISHRKAAEQELAEAARLSNLRADVAALLASQSSLDESLQGCCALLVNHLDCAFARIWTTDPEEPVLVLRASAGLYTHIDGDHARVPIGKFKIGRIAQHRRAHLTNDVANDPNVSNPEWAKREGMRSFAGYPLIADGRILGVMALFSKKALTEVVLGDLAPIADAIASNIEHRAAEAALIAEKERAEIASHAKDNFLAALSHELRTPLTPVLMTATALRDDERIPADIRADLGMIERNIALEARLIDDLLDLTAISKGKLQLREELCDVHSLIGLATEIVRDEAQSKPVALHLELAARKTALLGDPSRLQQVFWNLLRNAIKFTPTQGRVSIHTRDETDGRLRIEVRDTGMGIDPQAIESVFQPFEQAGRENDHRFGGLGLGLAIARAIVGMHGGTIWADSEGPGKGATFVIELPGAREQASGVTDESEKNSHETALKDTGVLRLLLVEDHEPTLTVLRRLLVRAGHEVTTAGDIATAVAAAKATLFDVVISDVGLPDGTGFELISLLQGIQPALKGIALSGYGMENDLRRSREAGFSAHLVKPVDFDQLRRALRELLSA